MLGGTQIIARSVSRGDCPFGGQISKLSQYSYDIPIDAISRDHDVQHAQSIAAMYNTTNAASVRGDASRYVRQSKKFGAHVAPRDSSDETRTATGGRHRLPQSIALRDALRWISNSEYKYISANLPLAFGLVVHTNLLRRRQSDVFIGPFISLLC
jgi:hypothetical protein